MPCIWYTKEREKHFSFTQPYISNPMVIVTNKKNKIIKRIEDLKGKKVAFITGYAVKNSILKKFPEIKPVIFKSPLEALLMVNLGSVDAYIDSLGLVSYQIDKNLLSGLQIAGKLEMEGVENINNLYMAVRKDWPILYGLFEKALADISEEERLQLHGKWLMKIDSDSKGEFRLLADEQRWLRNIGNFKLGFENSAAPLQYLGINTGLKGIASDYVRQIEGVIHKKFEVKPVSDFWGNFIALQKNQVDIICTSANDENAQVCYTQPFMSIPVVILTHNKKAGLISKLSSLETKKVGVVKGSGLGAKLELSFNLKNVESFNSSSEALMALEAGRIHAFCGDLATASYYLQYNGSSAAQLAYTTDYKVDVCFAVRNEHKQLAVMIDRYLSSVSESQRAGIEHKWLNLHVEKGTSLADYWRELTLISLFLLMVFGIFVFWNRSLTKEISERLKIEKSLVEARQEAEESDRAKGEFLAMMSHEIRTPLNGVIGMSQLLEESELNKEQREQCEIIVGSGKSLLVIINDVLDFSKADAGKMQLESQPFNLKKVISSTTELYSQQFAEKELAVTIEYEPDLNLYYKGDEVRVRQVMLNLLSNALKFTQEGGVKIHVSKLEDSVTAENVQIAVTDTGIGISLEAKKRLFNKFTQADASTTRKYGGTGLGLAICKKIVELMAGEISIESELGKGSTFTFNLNLEKSSIQKDLKALSSVFQKVRTDLNVLLVEDNNINKIIAEKILTNIGCTVRTAENGLIALVALNDDVPDLIFMDCHMPEMDGYEATRKIRSDERFDKVPIIALTANAQESDREKCLSIGMNDFLTKPYNKDIFEKVVLSHSIKKAI